MKRFLKLFCIGAVGYSLIELLWRGFTHWTMGITGGLCFSLLYGLNQRLKHRILWIRCLTGACLITVIEFITGCLVNLWLRWSVWDYSNLKYNVLGQISLLYSVLWFFLTIPVFFLAGCLKMNKKRKIAHNDL